MTAKNKRTDVRIVVAISGWVFMGEYKSCGDHVTLENASCVRVWGTSAGLGEIALHGPTERTVLDPAGFVEIPMNSVVATIKCTYCR